MAELWALRAPTYVRTVLQHPIFLGRYTPILYDLYDLAHAAGRDFGVVCMVYCSTCFLGWIYLYCVQTLHLNGRGKMTVK